jgi:aldehyde:ferredoxin oxidoreductase
MLGFHGRLLRIDATQHTYHVEQIPDRVLRRYLGGRGLGSYLLWSEMQAGTDPLGPDNLLIITSGSATGAGVPGSSRYGLFSRSPLTGTYAESTAGGRMAPQLSRTGYDAIVIRGASSSPVYVQVSDQGVDFHDAALLWGMDTYAAEEAMLAQTPAPQAQAIVIGPAGENLVRIACVENKWRSAGRGGMGDVLGSKKIKGLVFHGQTERPIAGRAGLDAYVKALQEKGKDSPAARNYSRFGTPMSVALTNTAGVFPSHYWTAGSLPNWDKIGAEYLLENFDVRPRACPGCFLACGKVSTVKRGCHKGLTIEGPEYETIYALGGR